ncbi:zf-HC2 domain-containing protein [Nitriliruptor alkaliphilus]|uniref:zf-HC2 domain-containing protein n=1 Tax=Nitriliruptor alkaliphilus TaxID=427918 RepID=UPI00146FFF9E|nr:anti-sigma factor [Nitriliruptor alkaliphilus]
MNAHERYEELAVGHVLGGLGAAEAADFRSHLLGCRDCRMRVAELRDIAADLAAAEREERSEARLRTEVARRTAEQDEEARSPSRPGVSSRLLGALVVVAVVVFGALAFWNLHLRTQVTALGLLADRQDATLAELASGVSVTVDAVHPTSGLVVVDEDEVAFSFAELPTLARAERYVVWLVGTADGGDEAVLIARTDDRRVAGVVERDGADELLVTVEDGPAGATAAVGREVARAALTGG